MTKLPAVAIFFAAAAVLSGCQPQTYYSNCPIEEPYWTRGDYYSYSGWTETYPDDVYVDDSVYVDSAADDVYVDDNTYVDSSYVDNGYYVDDSSVIVDDGYVDDGYSYQDSTFYDDPGVEEYYPSDSSYYSQSSSYYSPSSSYDDSGVEEYYFPPSSSYYLPSSSSSTYYSPWPSVSYPSPSWRNRFVGRQQSMYYYPSNNSISLPNWQPVRPYYY